MSPKARIPDPPPWRKQGRRAPSTAVRQIKKETYPKSPAQSPTSIRLCAIDPGITTGMAFRLDGKLHTCVGYNDEEVLDLLYNLDFVVVERFQTAGRLSTPGLITIELVGAIKGWLRAQGIPFEIATPQARYAFMTEAYNNIGVGRVIEPSNVAKHQRDALAHLLSWEYRNKQK